MKMKMKIKIIITALLISLAITSTAMAEQNNFFSQIIAFVQPKNSDGKGIGGTGFKPGSSVGIYGRITGFGSIYVNGIEVHYSKTTPIQVFGKTATSSQLQIGQVVSLIAESKGDKIVAKDIYVDSALSGRLENINNVNNTVTISGETVRVNNIEDFNRNFALGDNLAVSGLREAGGEIEASYVEKSDDINPAPVLAPLDRFKDIEHIVIETYVSDIENDHHIILPEGTKVKTDHKDIEAHDRVIVSIERDDHDNFHAHHIEVEHDEVNTDFFETDREELHKREMNEDFLEINNEGHENKSPEVEHQEIEHGEITHPEMEHPEVEHPEVEHPEAEAPEIEAPEIEAPEIEHPEIEMPEIEHPEIEMPEIEAPEIEMPEIEPPEIEVPEIH